MNGKGIFKTAMKNPRKTSTAIDKALEEHPELMNETVELEVPEKYAKLFTKFATVKEGDSADEETTALIKEATNANAVKKSMMSSDKKVRVKLNLKKVKKIITRKDKALDAAEKEKEETPVNESLDPMNEDAMTVAVGMLTGWTLLVVLALMVYEIYVIYLMVKYKHFNLFDNKTTVNGALLTAGTYIVLCFVCASLLWWIFMHIRIMEKIKEEESKGITTESVLAMIAEANLMDDDAAFRFDWRADAQYRAKMKDSVKRDRKRQKVAPPVSVAERRSKKVDNALASRVKQAAAG